MRDVNGAPGVTRTPGTQFRKLLLYPPELRGRVGLSRASEARYPAPGLILALCAHLCAQPVGSQLYPSVEEILARERAERSYFRSSASHSRSFRGVTCV
jgi:hypothetical protein